jgi:hypothetical protein
MGKLFGLVILLAALWVGLTVYTGGVEGLTGQISSGVSGSEGGEDARGTSRSLSQRFGDQVDDSMDKRKQQMAERLDAL